MPVGNAPRGPAPLLVTGSAGQIGSYVVDEAVRRRLEVRGLDLRPSKWTTHKADVRDPQVVADALKGCPAVIHLAAQISVQHSIEDPLNDLDHNVRGTITLLEAARKADTPRFVFTSSAAVYGRPSRVPVTEGDPPTPLSPYGLSKLAAEGYVRNYTQLHGLKAFIVRPFNVYSIRQDPMNAYSGVLSKFAARVRAGQPPVIFGNGAQTRDFVHAADVARFMVDVAQGASTPIPGEPINVGTGHETSILQVAQEFLKAADMRQGPSFEPARPGEIERSVAAVGRAKELGFKARIALQAGVQELITGVPLVEAVNH